MKHLIVDRRWHIGGIGRYAHEVLSRLDLPSESYFDTRFKASSVWGALALSVHLRNAKRSTIFYSPGFMPPVVSRATSVLTIHDLMYLNPVLGSAAQQRYTERVILPLARKAPAIFTVSESAKYQIEQHLGASGPTVVNAGNGVDSKFFRRPPVPIEQRQRQLLFIGGDKANKNLPRALEAFVAATRERSLTDVRLVVVGNTSTIDKKNYNGNVRFIEGVDDSQLIDLYRESIALLMPSIEEGFGLPAAESIACGTPVIHSNVPSLEGISIDSRLRVEAENVGSIESAIRQAIEKPQPVTDELQAAIRRTHSWDSVAGLVTQTLKALLAT